MADPIKRLYKTVVSARDRNCDFPKATKLFKGGPTKIAKKLVEEATEVSLEYVTGNRGKAIREFVDMLYHWVVLLAETGVKPSEIWEEMVRRYELLGIASKLPKGRMTVAK